MAKTKIKSQRKSSSKDFLRSTTSPLINSAPAPSSKSIEDLLTEAASLLEQSQPDLALPLAEQALQRLELERQRSHPNKQQDEYDIDELLILASLSKPTAPETLVLNGEINVSLENIDAARWCFERATNIDKDGALVSAEPYLWLAQLSEEGGRQSIHYFEQACEVLRNEIDVLEDALNEMDTSTAEDAAGSRRVLDEKRSKLADALCAMSEVYMTDLSWQDDAEQRCEGLVTEAVAVCPEYLSAGVLQTLANVRISQERIEDARTSLQRSLEIWYRKPPSPTQQDQESAKDTGSESEEDENRKPPFATRISLSRLLMEVSLLESARAVLDGLAREDDQSVETWYLGGWCQVLLSQDSDTTDEVKQKHMGTAKTWLDTCLRLYREQDYDDERMRDHALELVAGLKKGLGVEGDMEDDVWEDMDKDDEDDNADDEEIEVEDVEVKMNGHAVASDGDVEMS
jgi:hypothetical protein